VKIREGDFITSQQTGLNGGEKLLFLTCAEMMSLFR